MSADGMALARYAHRNKKSQMSATALKTKTATNKASRDKRTGCQVWGKAPETEPANGIWREGGACDGMSQFVAGPEDETGHGAPLLLRFKPGI